MVKVAIQIGHPRSVVFTILTEYTRYPEWIPGCEKSTVLSSAGNVATTELVLNSMKKISMSLRFDAEPDQLLKFELVSSKDVKGYSGSYKLMNATDGGVVLIAELELDAGAMAPKFMVDRMLKSSLEQMGDAIRKHAKTMPAPVVETVVKEARPDKKHKPKRPKCLLRVVKTDKGERVWYGGKMYGPE